MTGDTPPPGEDPQDEVVICRISSSSMFTVPLEVGNCLLSAVVDTAAEVSIISDRAYDKLDPRPPKLRDVFLHAAGRGMRMKGMIVGPVALKLGDQSFSVDIYVAPIGEEMLLGLDFLRQHGVTIHIQPSHLRIGDKHIPMRYSKPPPNRVAQVSVPKRTATPPNREKRITGVLDQRKGNDNTPLDEPALYGRIPLVNATKRSMTPPNKMKRITGVIDQRKGKDHPPFEHVEPAPYGRLQQTSAKKRSVTPPNKVKRITGVIDQRVVDERIRKEYSEPTPYGKAMPVYASERNMIPPNKLKRITGVLDQRGEGYR